MEVRKNSDRYRAEPLQTALDSRNNSLYKFMFSFTKKIGTGRMPPA